MPKAPTVYDFMKRFPDDDACLEHVMRLRYGETFDCPSCGRNGRYSRIKKRPVYQCSYCSHQISPKVGTPFQKSPGLVFCPPAEHREPMSGLAIPFSMWQCAGHGDAAGPGFVR